MHRAKLSAKLTSMFATVFIIALKHIDNHSSKICAKNYIMIIEIKIKSFPGISMIRLLTSVKILTNLAKKFGFSIEVKKYSQVKSSIYKLEAIVCEEMSVYFNKEISPESLKIKTRKREICGSRQIVMKYMLESETCKDVGLFYKLDHATALHAEKTVEELTFSDIKYRNAILKIESRIKELT